eukprot:359768-Chlamydomonas_euryale.AAC.4
MTYRENQLPRNCLPHQPTCSVEAAIRNRQPHTCPERTTGGSHPGGASLRSCKRAPPTYPP